MAGTNNKDKAKVDRCSELAKWDNYQLRLFFSADVVGSTAFKQMPEGGNGGSLGADPRWFEMVLSFYHQAEKAFSERWASYMRHLDGSDGTERWFGEAPEVWKTVGDEVLFTKVVEHPMQAVIATHAWCHALEDMRRQLKEKFKLDVKSCVWLADFPLHNQEVVLGYAQPGSDDDYIALNRKALASFHNGQTIDRRMMLRDFIGPSIDTGFRLGTFASPRKLIISLELAHLLATEQAYAESNPGWHAKGPSQIRKFIFRYEGKHPLKGVIGGSPYPIFWIDLDAESALNRAEDSLIQAVPPTSHQVKDFTGAMLNRFHALLSAPCFFKDESTPDIASIHAVISDNTKAALRSRASAYSLAEEKHAKESRDLESDDEAPLPADTLPQRTQQDILESLRRATKKERT